MILCQRSLATVVIAVAALIGCGRKQAGVDTAADAGPPTRQVDAGMVLIQPIADSAPEDWNDRWGFIVGELYRQAIYMAARDRLGLSTRDPVIGEEGTGGAAGPYQLRFRFDENDGIKATLSQEPGSEPIVEFAILDKQPLDYRRIAGDAYDKSRELFVDSLSKAGAKAQIAPPKQSETTIPEEVAARLAELTLTSQFDALRRLHQILRTNGPSPQVLAGLIRGYAMLGVQTEAYWSSAHRVFKARSLLYACELSQLAPEDPSTHWNWGYALALVGRPGDALEAIAKGDSLSKEETPPGASGNRPDWVEPLLPFCRCRPAELTRLAANRQGPARDFALLLALLNFENSEDTLGCVETSQSLLESAPECYRALATLCDQGGVSSRHESTVAGERTMLATYAARLQQMPGLPDAVTSALAPRGFRLPLFGGSSDTRPAVFTALDIAGRHDPEALSWSVLAQLLREESFRQVFARANFLRHSLVLPADDYVAASRALAQRHPYAPVLDALGLPLEATPEQFRKTVEKSTIGNPDTSVYPALQWMHDYNAASREASDIFKRAMINGDLVVRDQRINLFFRKREHKIRESKALLGISPHDAYATVFLIQFDWETMKPQADALAKEFAHSEGVLVAIGSKFYYDKDYAASRGYFKQAVAASPSRKNYEWLAATYRDSGDLEQYQATLEEYLSTQPDYALDHAQVQSAIARAWMRKGDYRRALPFARQASDTGAQWGMVCLADCLTGLEQWNEAERWLQIAARRYPGGWSDWYYWCRRTGKGNLAAARRMASDALADQEEDYATAMFWLTEGDIEKGTPILQAEYGKSHRSITGLWLAASADALKNTSLRDSTLTEILKYENETTDFHGFVSQLGKSLRGDELRLDDFETYLQSKETSTKGAAAFYLGLFLENRGRNDDAARLFQQTTQDDGASHLHDHAAIGLRRVKPN